MHVAQRLERRRVDVPGRCRAGPVSHSMPVLEGHVVASSVVVLQQLNMPNVGKHHLRFHILAGFQANLLGVASLADRTRACPMVGEGADIILRYTRNVAPTYRTLDGGRGG